MSNTGLVRQFISGWNNHNLQALTAILSPAARYNGEPIAACNPKVPFNEGIRRFAGAAAMPRWIVHEIVEASSGKVFVERTDQIRVENILVEIRAVAVFEVAGGTIVSWRDYQDLDTAETLREAAVQDSDRRPVKA